MRNGTTRFQMGFEVGKGGDRLFEFEADVGEVWEGLGHCDGVAEGTSCLAGLSERTKRCFLCMYTCLQLNAT